MTDERSESPAGQERHAPQEALAGIKVIDLSAGVAGQFAGRVLGEHGADVVLVEPPEGCALRRPRRTEDRHLFRHLNTGKRAVALDRATPTGRAALAALVAGADVVIVDDGTDPAPWLVGDPRVVGCAIRDFAPHGPYAEWQGSEMIHQALSGLMYTTGRAEAEPLYGFGYRAYYSAGAAAVAAIVGALIVRRRTGRGQWLDIRVHETAVAMSQNLVAQYSYNGSWPARGPYPGACDLLQCRDGWASFYCRGDRWRAFCAELGVPDLPGDARFAAIDVLLRNWQAAYEVLAPVVRVMTVDDFVGRVIRARGLASRVNTMADALACPHLGAREFWERTPGLTDDTLPSDDSAAQGARVDRPLMLGPLFRMSATPRRVRGPSPPPGARLRGGEGA